MRICTCNRVHSHGKPPRYTADQCRPCWEYAHVKSCQAAAGLPQTGVYATRAEAFAPIRSPLVCIHEGAILEYCHSCNGEAKHVRECDLHGKCTRGVVSDKVRSCSTCPDHFRELFRDYPDPLWTWAKPTDEQAHIAAFRRMVAAEPPRYPGDDGRRGVIWTCHSPRFWPMVVIGVRILREVLHCTLPVQVWWRSTCGTIRPELVEGLSVELIDRDALAMRLGDSRLPLGDANTGGWEAKLYAATHTRFRSFWMLDSDAMFVADPTDVVPTSAFGYWVDLKQWKHLTNWLKWGMTDEANAQPQVQAGHLWIDRRRAWKLLAVVHHLCEHSDYWFSHSNDDQSCFRAALAAGVCPEHELFGDLNDGSWVQKAFVCRYQGVPLITHYCQHKLFLDWLSQCDQIPLNAERLSQYARLILECL
jgi:hypothetical protein